jgi:hypothetical protein
VSIWIHTATKDGQRTDKRKKKKESEDEGRDTLPTYIYI